MNSWYHSHNFKPFSVASSAPRPALAVAALDSFALVHVTGEEALTYLQGQLTCDLHTLAHHSSILGAHCDAKGKVWAVLRLFYHMQGIAYIVPQSVLRTQLEQIEKYAVFAKLTFTSNKQVLLGVLGEKADNTMQARFFGKGDIRATQTGTAIRIEPNRWLLAIDPQEADQFINDLGARADLCDSTLWELYELNAGLPNITQETCNEFIPQAINLQALDAISFKKGCYTGQETVARAKYRGINKRAAFLLTGGDSVFPKPGDSFERSIDGFWRSGGTVLRSFRFSDNKAMALVVLPSDLEPSTYYRPSGSSEHWQIIPLPYELDDI
ncbi:MAG: tRNA-modifying protein YgfZ [Vibrionaceae bacterium]